MRFAAPVVTVVMSLVAAPAFADNGHVPQSTLASLGLAGMERLSDEQGMEIRGTSGNAFAMSLSVVTGFLIDPTTKNFVGGTDANAAMANAENAGKHAPAHAFTASNSALALSLNIQLNGAPFFNGYVVGGAGGNAKAWSP